MARWNAYFVPISVSLLKASAASVVPESTSTGDSIPNAMENPVPSPSTPSRRNLSTSSCLAPVAFPWHAQVAISVARTVRNLSPEALVQLCIDHHLPTIAYTYTEPLTWFEYTLESCQLAHAHGLKNVLVSAGYINPAPLQELAPYLDAVNIDLKSLSEDIYREVSGATLAPVLNTLLTLKSAGVWLEITHLLIPPVQDTTHFRRLCQWLRNNNLADCPLHLTRFFPQYKMQHGYSATPLSFMHEAQSIALEEGIRTVYLGNV